MFAFQKTNVPAIDSWFQNKPEYLVWRDAWKQEYARLTEEIRGYKQDMRDKDPGVRSSGQWHRHVARKRAAYLNELRKESKLEAQRQYQALKTLTANAA